MAQMMGWHDADTDSEQSGSSGCHTPEASPAAKLLAGSGQNSGASSLSAEELGRLQDELMALRMHNHELLQEKRWLSGAGPAAMTGAPAPPPPPPPPPPAAAAAAAAAGAAALRRSLSMQVSAQVSGAISAFGTKGNSMLNQRGMPTEDAGIGAYAGEDDMIAAEKEALRAEAEQLQSKIRAAMEEVAEFRTVAGHARQAAAAAAAQAAHPMLVMPSVSDIRQRVTEELSDLKDGSGSEEQEQFGAFNDAMLRLIAEAVLRVVREQQQAANRDVKLVTNVAGQPMAELDKGDEALLQRKISAQQQELDRLLDVFHGQQEQIMRLRDQLSGKADSEKRRVLEEKLHYTERQVEGLTRQLETSEEGARQSQELRVRLRTLATETVQRGQILAELRSMDDVHAAERTLLQERLQHTLEDLDGLARCKVERRQRWQHAVSPREVYEDPTPCASHEKTYSSTAGPTGVVEQCETTAVGSTRLSEGQCAIQISADPSSAGSAGPSSVLHEEHLNARLHGPAASIDAEVQAELLEDGTVAALKEAARLQTEIEDLKVERAVLQKRSAKQLQELRSLVQPPRMLGRRAAAELAEKPAGAAGKEMYKADLTAGGSAPSAATPKPPPVAAVAKALEQLAVHDISSDGEEAIVDGTLRPQVDVRVETVDGPRQPRHIAGEAGPMVHPEGEQCEDETADTAESDYHTDPSMLYVQRVAELEQHNEGLKQQLDKLHQAESALRAENKDKNDLITHLMQGANLKGDLLGADRRGQERGFWRRELRGGGLRELQQTIEETQSDNIRLRNEIQVMAGRFRTVLSGANASSGTREAAVTAAAAV